MNTAFLALDIANALFDEFYICKGIQDGYGTLEQYPDPDAALTAMEPVIQKVIDTQKALDDQKVLGSLIEHEKTSQHHYPTSETEALAMKMLLLHTIQNVFKKKITLRFILDMTNTASTCDIAAGLRALATQVNDDTTANNIP